MVRTRAAKAKTAAKTFVGGTPAKAPPKNRRAVKWNRQGQRWAEDRIGMTLRLPPDLEVEIRKVALAKGDLTRIVLFAVEHVAQHDVDLVKMRKAGLGLGRPMLLHVGPEARQYLRGWAEKEQASVNQVVVRFGPCLFPGRLQDVRRTNLGGRVAFAEPMRDSVAKDHSHDLQDSLRHVRGTTPLYAFG